MQEEYRLLQLFNNCCLPSLLFPPQTSHCHHALLQEQPPPDTEPQQGQSAMRSYLNHGYASQSSLARYHSLLSPTRPSYTRSCRRCIHDLRISGTQCITHIAGSEPGCTAVSVGLGRSLIHGRVVRERIGAMIPQGDRYMKAIHIMVNTGKLIEF